MWLGGRGVISPARILVLRLSALGDVLLATPAVRALRARFPAAGIDWLVEEPYLPLVEGNPHVRALAYRKTGRHAGIQGLRRLRAELRERDYDLAVDLQGKPKSWFLRGAARRAVAVAKRSPGQAARALLGLDRPLTRVHAIDLCLEPLAPLGVESRGRELELRLGPAAVEEAATLSLPPRPVGIAPGARWATKRWPAERFGEVAAGLAGAGFSPVLIAGPGDGVEIAAVRSRLPPGVAAPDTAGLSVGGMAAVVSRLDLLVAGDSGPVHVASALGTPVLALFGPTSPERWRPLSARSAVLRLPLPCSPCSNHGSRACPLGHHDCLRKLGVDEVLAAALRLVGK